MRLFLICLGAFLSLCLPGLTEAHPCDGYLANELPSGYGTEYFGLNSELNINDITFHSPYPDPESLSENEKYIVAGCSGSSLGYPLGPWYRRIALFVNAVYTRTGEVPTAITERLIRATSPSISDEQIDAYRSPLTGEFPRLDATYFSTGDIYMRLLTEEEKEFLGQMLEQDREAWFEGRAYNSETDDYDAVQILGGVFYMRVYGLSEVLHSSIEYVMVPAL